ncbi:rop guanine nucleotide exchange factor 1-like [Macadamia integrifolia]|uniref:rop guanine nucleotide exchange factor 1-like n=1 Tax=Macadamia integrifolia TaxID=60698 RepID=UPI001C4F3BAD|nr:rop guanine nucleotide exchange factor 1-like [Macadamia integrifolia]
MEDLLYCKDKRTIPPCHFYFDMSYSLTYSTIANISTEISRASTESTISSETSLDGTTDESKSNADFTLIDLYSGYGAMSAGLCLGANLSGTNLVTKWAVDINKYVCENLKLNTLKRRLLSMNYQVRLGMMAADCYGLPQFHMRKLPQYPLPMHEVVVRGNVLVNFQGANFRDLSCMLVRPDKKVEWDKSVERVYLPSGKPLLSFISIIAFFLICKLTWYQLLLQSGKACLGEIIYRYITADQFSPECLLDCLDLSTEHHTSDIANRIEAAVHVWRLKDPKKRSNHAKTGRSSWGGKVKGLVGEMEKSHILAQRAETLLQSLRIWYPGLPQTVLDMNKIQYNKDVGQSILESYSRVMESLAFNIMARIDDLLYVDDAIRQCAVAESMSLFGRGGLGGLPIQKRISPSPFSIQRSPYASSFATPTFSATPVVESPGRGHPSLKKNNHKGSQDAKLEKSADVDRIWSYAGNLSSRKDAGDAPERD